MPIAMVPELQKLLAADAMDNHFYPERTGCHLPGILAARILGLAR